jgi:hypothetical protein
MVIPALCAISTSAALTTAIPLAGSASGVVTTANAPLTTAITPAASLVCAVAANGTLTTQIRLNGTATGVVTVTAT